ncbi:MAG: class IV adenylate cyclase [Planctomycetota bacterium]|jgi:adenylate cyclase class 2
MPRELEAKFKVANFSGVRRALRAAGAVYRGTAIETDAFFDTPKRTLYRSGRAMRLRRVRMIRSAENGRTGGWLLTVKSRRQDNPRVKIRREIQTRVEDGEVLSEILHAAGLREMIRLEKRRASYSLGKCLGELDELEGLGCFVEIEAPTQRMLNAARRKLNLPDNPITATYTQLLAERRKS